MRLHIEADCDEERDKINAVDIHVRGQTFFCSRSWNTDLIDRPSIEEGIVVTIGDLKNAMISSGLQMDREHGKL